MSDILKEAIADAKTVRETALKNAKDALQEAFAPHLKSMLSAKLAEDDDERNMRDDEMEMDEMETKEGHKGYKKMDHEDRDEFDGRKSKVVGVYSNIDKQRMGESKKKTLKLTESQLINIIEKVVKEREK